MMKLTGFCIVLFAVLGLINDYSTVSYTHLIAKFMGHNVIGDVHLGDWGLQMGLIITELRERKPDLEIGSAHV